ncbi:neuroligin-4, Y-linked-like [Tubulanus polymorphus]|uniref:neuroligin-4, Y-linked-like n=1 Tax=Tubulanus polymorphus TaxID=672921 RepID=UPI003DA513A2
MVKISELLRFLVVWFLLVGKCTSEYAVIETRFGQIRGSRTTKKYGIGEVTETVDIFLGVPYAQPPVDELRFENPERCRPWTQVLDATKLPRRCPQLLNPDLEDDRSEDCLYVNIYSPFQIDRPNARYPVMLYIHGGSYSGGAGGDYDGHVLAQYGVVVITLNYRLGVLGFLTTGDKNMAGNYGLSDQIFALKWIQENIYAFRGDRNQVTIFGNSAGGASVGLLTISPMSKGLFHRAIIESGAMNSFWAVHKESTDLSSYFYEVANIVDCKHDEMAEIKRCLKTTPWIKFFEHRFPRITPSATDLKPWIDGHVLPSSVDMLLKGGLFNKVPVMAGTTKHEWAKNMGWFLEDFDHDLNDFSKGFDRTTYELAIEYVTTVRFEWPRDLVDVILFEYTNWTQPNNPMSNREQYIQFFTDVSMVAPTVQMSEHFARHRTPLYFYTFDYIREATIPVDAPLHEHPRIWAYNYSYHESELNYVFGAPFSSNVIRNLWVLGNFTAADRLVSKRMMKLWTNFAKYSNPTADSRFIEDIKWEQFKPRTSDHLVIEGSTCRMDQHLRLHWVTFWNRLVPRLLQKMEAASVLGQRKVYSTEMWSFIGLSVFLCVLLVVLVTVMCKNQRNTNDYRYKPPPAQV